MPHAQVFRSGVGVGTSVKLLYSYQPQYVIQHLHRHASCCGRQVSLMAGAALQFASRDSRTACGVTPVHCRYAWEKELCSV